MSAKSIELVDHEAWGVKKNPPRTPVDVDSFTSISKTVLQRAKLEFERRFMNNTDDTLFLMRSLRSRIVVAI